MTVFSVRFIAFEPLVELTKRPCQIGIVLSFNSSLTILGTYSQKNTNRKRKRWDDVQCLCLTKVGSRSRSEFNIKHCMTYQIQYRWLPLKQLTLFPHVAHGVFINFCDSSSLRFYLPLQKKLIPSSDIRGETWLLLFPKAPV